MQPFHPKNHMAANTFLLRLMAVLAAVAAAFPGPIHAFPPAPVHTLLGIVRDQVGNPLDGGAEVILETPGGVSIRTIVTSRIETSINYELKIPMDAGVLDQKYHPTALLPFTPFRLRVKLGKTTYLPMEMTGDLSKIGEPAGRTRIDLTLGIDADGNGLPDAWEKSAMQLLGGKWEAGKIRPEDLYPGSGMTFRDVYLAGTYAVQPKEGFALSILPGSSATPKLAFTAVKGRSYRIEACSELGQWSPVSFVVSGPSENSTSRMAYLATSTRRIEIEVPSARGSDLRFFRMKLE